VARLVARLRERWPTVRILLRADSGFAREELMKWCEESGVDFLFGLARNVRLVAEITAELAAAEAESKQTAKPARRFKDFLWTTRESWSRRRRVIAKAEWTQGEANPRFLVTSLTPDENAARYLYETVYCARGEAENRIKECQLDLPHPEPVEGRRPHLGRDHACQPAPPVVRLDGLCPAHGLAPHRPRQDPVRQGHLRHDPPQAPQNRRSRPRQRPPHPPGDELGLPLPAGLRCRASSARRRGALMNQKA
jgi:hypothetical protein